MTEPDLQAIRARADAATPGPWVVEEHEHWIESATVWDAVEQTDDKERRIIFFEAKAEADTIFTAYARTDVPALLDLIESQQAEIKRLEAMISPYGITDDRCAAVVYSVLTRRDECCSFWRGHEGPHGTPTWSYWANQDDT